MPGLPRAELTLRKEERDSVLAARGPFVPSSTSSDRAAPRSRF